MARPRSRTLLHVSSICAPIALASFACQGGAHEPHGPNQVTLHVSTSPERPAIISLSAQGGASFKGCDRTPCDVVVDKGKTFVVDASLGGAGGSTTVVADGDKDVVVPLSPRGLPPPGPPPMPPPVPHTSKPSASGS